MTHFSVLVIGDNWEEQLAPYSENLEVTAIKVLIPKQEVEQILSYESYKGRKKQRLASYFNQHVFYNGRSWYRLSTDNPNSKWDWYVMGGRWTGFFKVKAGCNGKLGERPLLSKRIVDPLLVDQCRKKDIDVDGTRNHKVNEVLSEWDGMTVNERTFNFPRYKDRDDLIAKNSEEFLRPFAFIKEGVWHNRGETGEWTPLLSEEESNSWSSVFNAMYDSLPPDTLLTIVDCHI